MSIELNLTNCLLALNAVLGLAAFEWAWFKTRRFRNPIQALDEQFPELRRFDAPHWAKWRHYPGAVTLMFPRILTSFMVFLTMAIVLNIILIGHNRSKPITGVRKVLS